MSIKARLTQNGSPTAPGGGAPTAPTSDPTPTRGPTGTDARPGNGAGSGSGSGVGSGTAATPPAGSRSTRSSTGRPGMSPAVVDPLIEVRRKAQELMFERMGSRLFDPNLTQEQLRGYVVEEIRSALAESTVPLTEAEREDLVSAVVLDLLGYGPIQALLDDVSVSEIMVNSTEPIWVERHGQLEETPRSFASEDHLRRVIDRIVDQIGRRVDESSPMVDARLPDGSRVNAVIPPLAVDGPALTIRKFSHDPLTIDDLIGFGSMSSNLSDLLRAAVAGRVSILISGGTGTGKTTMLNVISNFIPDGERLVTIEDAVELQLQQRHVVRLETRPPNVEGKGEVEIRALVRNSLRMRPDRIIVGEVRGAEALDMLQAMNTGHEGSLTTLHANSPRDALARLETMVLMAGLDLPLAAIREQIASAIQLIVQIGRLSDGTRRVTQVAEVVGMESGVIQLGDLFLFETDGSFDASGHFVGQLVPTGIRPDFERQIRQRGIELPTSLFDSPRTAERR